MKAVVVGALVAVCLGCLMALVTATRDARRARSRLPIPADPRLARAAEERHARLHRALTAADIALTSTEALRLAGWSVLAAAPVGFLLGGPALAVAAVLAAAAAGPAALLALHGRRDRRADAGLPSVLDDIARALRAGVAPVAAMEAASREPGERAARSDLRAVVDDVQAGLALVDALERWRERRPSGPVRLAVGSLAIGVSTGGTRSQAVEAVAATLRERQAVEREAAALATQARSSAVVIALAPLGFAALASLSDPRAAAFLVGTPVGWGCLIAGLVLDGVGAWWMHRIVELS